MNAKIGLLSVVFTVTVLGGCSTVKPWEREYLADEIMQFDPDPLKTEWHQHVQEVLGGDRGGLNGSGGGCGCR
ncbi:MAG: DUF4266 domain-containing protein [Nitrospirae bacterium]|nr:DUF4266 domain-containing protein [Nitrospirota bacterium]